MSIFHEALTYNMHIFTRQIDLKLSTVKPVLSDHQTLCNAAEMWQLNGDWKLHQKLHLTEKWVIWTYLMVTKDRLDCITNKLKTFKNAFKEVRVSFCWAHNGSIAFIDTSIHCYLTYQHAYDTRFLHSIVWCKINKYLH